MKKRKVLIIGGGIAPGSLDGLNLANKLIKRDKKLFHTGMPSETMPF